MKRSEGMQIISMAICKRLEEESAHLDVEIAAKYVLENIEAVGFKPPCSCSEDDTGKGYGPRCGISWHLHEWSEE